MRYVPYGQQIRDAESESFLGISGKAFVIRASDDGGLSVTWIEHYGEKTSKTIGIAADRFRDSLEKKKLAPKACFAIGIAGQTKAIASQYGKKVRLVHSPDGLNTGHVEVRRFSDEDRALLEALVDVFDEHVMISNLELPD